MTVGSSVEWARMTKLLCYPVKGSGLIKELMCMGCLHCLQSNGGRIGGVTDGIDTLSISCIRWSLSLALP